MVKTTITKTFIYKGLGYKTKKYYVAQCEPKDIVVWGEQIKYEAWPVIGGECEVTNLNARTSEIYGFQFHTTDSSRCTHLGAVSTRKESISPETIQSPIELSNAVRKTAVMSDKVDDPLFVNQDFFHCPHCSKKIFFYRENVI